MRAGGAPGPGPYAVLPRFTADGPSGPERPHAVPPAVEGVSAVAVPTTVTVTWTPSPRHWNVRSYDGSLTGEGGAERVDSFPQPPAELPEVPARTASVRVRAVNDSGRGPWSEPVAVDVPEPGTVPLRIDGGQLVSQTPASCSGLAPERVRTLLVSLDQAAAFDIQVHPVGPSDVADVTQPERAGAAGEAVLLRGDRAVALEMWVGCDVQPGLEVAFTVESVRALGGACARERGDGLRAVEPLERPE